VPESRQRPPDDQRGFLAVGVVVLDTGPAHIGGVEGIA
jgi:hypothetical protein